MEFTMFCSIRGRVLSERLWKSRITLFVKITNIHSRYIWLEVKILRDPDVEAIFKFIKPEDGGRKLCVSGYRPVHKVCENYLTTGIHHYYDKDIVYPGEFIWGTITFITPEYYPNCLWKGKIITIQEGRKIVGYAEIVKIFNEILRSDNKTEHDNGV
jgi:elongation factor Tu